MRGPIADILNFLAELLEQGFQYHSLNAYRSAISSVHKKINGIEVGKHPLVFASYSTVVLYSRDRYEIIGLLKISRSIKQPCSSVCFKKALEMHQKCLNNAVSLLNKAKNLVF